MRARLVLVLVVLFLLLRPSTAKAATAALLVNYNAKGAPVLKQPGDARLFVEDTDGAVKKLVNCDKESCVKDLEDQLVGTKAAVKETDALGGAFRWVATKADTLNVVVLFKGSEDTTPQVSYKEAARTTLLGQQIGTVLSTVFPTEKTLVEPILVGHDTYDLTLKRATLTVTIAPKGAEAPPAAKPATGKPTTSVTAVLTTGPKELAFLSADTVFNKISQNVYDKTAKTVKVRDAANHPYAGINLALNDVIASSWNPYLKGMMSIQSKPLDSWGLGAGLKLPSMPLGSFNFNTVSPFVAVTWDRSSAKLPTGAFVDGHRYKAHLRGGISLDVSGIAKAIKGGGGSSTSKTSKAKATQTPAAS